MEMEAVGKAQANGGHIHILQAKSPADISIAFVLSCFFLSVCASTYLGRRGHAT